MKRVFYAFAVLAIVGSALAFKPLGQGTIYCANNPDLNTICPSTSLVDITTTTDPNQGFTANPCTIGLNPYANFLGKCTPVPSGTRFIISDPKE